MRKSLFLLGNDVSSTLFISSLIDTANQYIGDLSSLGLRSSYLVCTMSIHFAYTALASVNLLFRLPCVLYSFHFVPRFPDLTMADTSVISRYDRLCNDSMAYYRTLPL